MNPYLSDSDCGLIAGALRVPLELWPERCRRFAVQYGKKAA